jgi:hypothetical protein
MRLLASAILVLIFGFHSTRAAAQDTPPVTSTSLLTQMAAAFSGSNPINSVELKGNVTSFPSGSGISGTATLIASADGSNKIRFQLANGWHTETRSAARNDRNCSWSGADGITHEAMGANCWTAIVPFLPQLSLQPALIPNALGTEFLGIKSNERGTYYAIRNQLIIAPGKTPLTVTQQIQKQSTTTLLIDPTTFLPAALAYTMQSDSGSASIAVEMRFSDYKQLSGLTVPVHIERYLNGSLQLAIDITQVSILN